MATDHDRYGQIAKIFSGEASQTDVEAIERWRNSNPEHEKLFREARHIWENSGSALSDNDVDSDVEWASLMRSLEKSETGARVFPMSRFYLLLGIAASVIIVFMVGLWFTRLADSRSEFISYSTEGEPANWFLPDSTRVWLNAYSTLTLSKGYGETDRKVTLTGEGFFKVKSDVSKRFVITTNHALVEVVGTAFNLKEDEGSVLLTVAEGLVKAAATDALTEPILVGVDEASRIRKGEKPAKGKNTDPLFASWIKSENPVAQMEQANPAGYMQPSFTWRKNTINQSVISGTLVSRAGFATYKNVVLKLTYTTANGKSGTTRIQITDVVKPGATVKFEKRLLDIFKDTKKINLEVESAEAVLPK